MKIMLISMIRNEANNVERCYKAVESLVDAYCVCDTGSTDNTIECVKNTLQGKEHQVFKNTWVDFGKNRSLSFLYAKKYAKSLGWKLRDTYGLLLDADMIFKDTSLKDWLEKSDKNEGYLITQVKEHENCEYPNVRLVRLDCDWVSIGITHEGWGIKDNNNVRFIDHTKFKISKDVCYIDDKDDGGYKADKFERDIKLLLKGLDDEPKNLRYKFFLGQSYMNLKKFKEAINILTQRVQESIDLKQDEEAWYSMYYIAKAHSQLNNKIESEYWCLKAYEVRPTRLEPLYFLIHELCRQNELFKAFEYAVKGVQIKYPENDVIFIEKDIYNHIFVVAKQLKDAITDILDKAKTQNNSEAC